MASSTQAAIDIGGLHKPELCVHFHTAGKRCKKGANCTWYHNEKLPTQYFRRLERKRAADELSEVEKGLGDGFLRSPTIAFKALLRQNNIMHDCVKAVQIVPLEKRYFVDVHFTEFQIPSSAAHEVHRMFVSVGGAGAYSWELPDGRSVKLTSGGLLQGSETMWHGSDWNTLFQVLRDQKLKAGDAHPKAVYALKSFEDIVKYGYWSGVAFFFEIMAFDASKACAKKLGAPIPGCCTYNPERSAPEYRFHEDSFTLKGARFNLDDCRTRLREAFPSPGASSGSSGSLVTTHREAKAQTSSASSALASGSQDPVPSKAQSSDTQDACRQGFRERYDAYAEDLRKRRAVSEPPIVKSPPLAYLPPPPPSRTLGREAQAEGKSEAKKPKVSVDLFL